MTERPHPTRNGHPVPIEELDLLPSRMNPDNPRNYSLHHRYYNSGAYVQDFVLNSLRNLVRSQDRMLKDQHNLGKTALHAIYGPFTPPTYREAMSVLEEAHAEGEQFRVWEHGQNGRKGHYKEVPFDDGYWAALKRYYNTVDKD